MKLIDMLAAALLVAGGINWGLYGLANVNLVESAAGAGTALAQVVYGAVGAAALYQLLGLRGIQQRWNVAPVRVGR